jgi:hypothetical protein
MMKRKGESGCMSDREVEVYMKDAPLARMGEMWAKLYYHMAKEMLTLGSEGEGALRRSIRNYAIDRGKTMRKQAEEQGLPLDWETFRITVKDMPFLDLCKEMTKYYPSDVYSSAEGFCAYAKVWERYTDGWNVAQIYCDEFHHAKWKAFNPKFRVDMVAEITRGDPVCILHSYEEGDEYDQQRQKDLQGICEKAKSYGFIIDSSPSGAISKLGLEEEDAE